MSLVASIMKSLNRSHFKTLLIMERLHLRYEYIPVEVLAKHARANTDDLLKDLDELHRLGLVSRRKQEYLGYSLKQYGRDALALKYLVDHGVLDAVGLKIAVGKEADVYDGLSPSGHRVAVKFHRVGRQSFRQTRRLRDYGEHHSWYKQSCIAARREYQALELLYASGVKAPKPVAYNRHVDVMEVIIGDPLYVVTDLPNPFETFSRVIDNVKRAYRDASIIHADLSEFNVIVKPDFEVMIIDWPQWVPRTHVRGSEYLKRDVTNICNFFKRRFGLNVDVEGILRDIKG
ncbi:MAG: RIO1 family regulatory kinase/ATPase [Candidatus Nezhaarchaeota archaeon]|nr:RIO1 family regulatory kinase/ATPase [Candidatus Nezhaarchaeota archaeon]